MKIYCINCSKVVGRIKEIIIPAGGENVAPTNIEDEIKLALPSLVSNVMVVGDGRLYLTCLITLKVGLESSIYHWCRVRRWRWISRHRSQARFWSSRPGTG